MKTYVEFIRPDKKIPAGVATTCEAAARDPLKLSIPPKCDIFYFYDSPIGNTAFASTEQYNRSKFYIVAERLLTRAEAKELIAPHLSKNTMTQLIWDTKLEKNRLFALTRNNNIEAVGRDNIVVDKTGRQLWPKPKRPKAAPSFNTATARDIRVRKPPAFRPPRPQ